jgi:arylsulfatase A-like enzyme
MESNIEHIFLIVIDCGRQDFLYGPEVDTPSLDTLRKECTVFTNAFSQANNTIPSHNSIFLSRFLCDHSIYDNYMDAYFGDTYLPLLLNKYGWKSTACVGITFLSWIIGERYFQNEKISSIRSLENPEIRGIGLRKLGIVKYRRNARKTIDRVISTLDKECDKPEFFWIHFFDAHFPYYAPKRFLEKFQYELKKSRSTGSSYQEVNKMKLFVPLEAKEFLRKTKGIEYFPRIYKASLEYIDYEIGRLITFLKKKGLWGKCLFIVTCDHGENLTENGVYCHHWKLFDETTRVPLYWRDPQINRSREVKALVQHVDIYPSILNRLGIAHAAAIRGKNLYPLMEGLMEKVHDFVFAEHANGYLNTIRTEEWQYIWKNPEKDCLQGLDLEEEYLIDRNTGERKNLASQYPQVCQELRKMGEKILSSPIKTEGEKRETSEAMRKILKGLGYIS